MQNFYLLRWLRENPAVDPDILDTIKFELDKRIYYYGEHFAFPCEIPSWKRKLNGIRAALKDISSLIAPDRGEKRVGSGSHVSSNAYFSFNSALAARGVRVSDAPWNLGAAELGSASLCRLIASVRRSMATADFRDLISENFAEELRQLRSGLRDYYVRADVSALVVPFDLPVFERMAIKIFRELGRPSFISLHGLPGRYNSLDDNRTDYLLVWGDRIKESYVRAGISPDKIFVTGHPSYQKLPSGKFRSSFRDILVISKSMAGAQHSAEEILSDRGNLIQYLYSVRKALTSIGVRSVRLRLHPSESYEWYGRFLDGDFFVQDRSQLSDSLSKASLVIGPTSTVFLESLLAGVNYLVYEPVLKGLDLANYPLVPPFDGSDLGIPVALSETELERSLSRVQVVRDGVLGGYIRTPFDISFMHSLISAKPGEKAL